MIQLLLLLLLLQQQLHATKHDEQQMSLSHHTRQYKHAIHTNLTKCQMFSRNQCTTVLQSFFLFVFCFFLLLFLLFFLFFWQFIMLWPFLACNRFILHSIERFKACNLVSGTRAHHFPNMERGHMFCSWHNLLLRSYYNLNPLVKFIDYATNRLLPIQLLWLTMQLPWLGPCRPALDALLCRQQLSP